MQQKKERLTLKMLLQQLKQPYKQLKSHCQILKMQKNLEQAKSKLAVAQAAYQAALASSNRSTRSKVAVSTAVQAQQAKATYDLPAQTYAEQNKEEDIRYYQSVLLIQRSAFSARSSSTGQARAPQHTTVQLLELELLKVELLELELLEY